MSLKKIISPLATRILTSSRLANTRRFFYEQKRKLLDQPHEIHFFFQVDDPYSFLVSQLLEKFKNNYSVTINIHLVAAPDDQAAPKKKELANFSLKDAKKIASFHDVEFADNVRFPSAQQISIAQRALVVSDDLLIDYVLIGRELWGNRFDPSKYQKLASEIETEAIINKGTSLRSQLGHYLSATFYYAGEWYWGIDRLPYLEERLSTLGVAKNPKVAISRFKKNCSKIEYTQPITLTVEFFISIRSPYSYLALPEILEFEKNYPVKTIIRPVMPMVMRGLAVPKNKVAYIVMDANREANRISIPFGTINDPLGNAVLRGYSLYPYALAQNKSIEYLLEFCRLAWAKGKDMNSEKNLRLAIENISLDWHQAKLHLDNPDWQESIEENRRKLIKSGLWGVPSFRLLDASQNEVFSSWGRDRIWLLTHEINNALIRN